MAFFAENDFGRLDWQLLQNGCVVLYWRREILNQDVKWLADNSYQIDSFECSQWAEEETLHSSFAKTLGFPDYYGDNLDALNDCLTDIEIPGDSGRVLVLNQFDTFAAKHPRVAQIVLDIAASRSRRFLLFGRRLIILVQSDDAKIAFEPVGAEPVDWNPREWLNKNGGM